MSQAYNVDFQFYLDAPDRWNMDEVKDIMRNTLSQALIDLHPAGVEFYIHGVGVTRTDKED